eukprot:scaffold11500_cov144-Skeletonema_menzelii.AAC.6
MFENLLYLAGACAAKTLNRRCNSSLFSVRGNNSHSTLSREKLRDGDTVTSHEQRTEVETLSKQKHSIHPTPTATLPQPDRAKAKVRYLLLGEVAVAGWGHQP